jgi:hypothetical protein
MGYFASRDLILIALMSALMWVIGLVFGPVGGSLARLRIPGIVSLVIGIPWAALAVIASVKVSKSGSLMMIGIINGLLRLLYPGSPFLLPAWILGGILADVTASTLSYSQYGHLRSCLTGGFLTMGVAFSLLVVFILVGMPVGAPLGIAVGIAFANFVPGAIGGYVGFKIQKRVIK